MGPPSLRVVIIRDSIKYHVSLQCHSIMEERFISFFITAGNRFLVGGDLNVSHQHGGF